MPELQLASLAAEALPGSKKGKRGISQPVILSQLVRLTSPMAIYSGTPIYTHTLTHIYSNSLKY